MIDPKSGEWIPTGVGSKFQRGDVVSLKPNSKAATKLQNIAASSAEVRDRRIGNLAEDADEDTIVYLKSGEDASPRRQSSENSSNLADVAVANDDVELEKIPQDEEDSDIAASSSNKPPDKSHEEGFAHPSQRENHAIVLVNYDVGIEFPDLPVLKLDSDSDLETLLDLTRDMSVQDCRDADGVTGKGKPSCNARDCTECNGESDDNGKAEGEKEEEKWFRTEKAMWMDIGRGYRFDYR